MNQFNGFYQFRKWVQPLLFICLITLSISCNSNQCGGGKITIPHNGLFILADGSSSVKQMDRFTTEFIEKTLATINTAGQEWSVQFYNIIHPYPHPVSCDIRVKADNTDKYNLEYKHIEEQNAQVDSINQVSCSRFVQEFEHAYITFDPRTAETGDYTYLECHLNAIAKNLTDTTFDRRVLLLYSDLIDHESQKKAKIISQETVDLLNQATQQGAEVYIVTYTDIAGTAVENLQANYLTHYTDFSRILKNSLPKLSKL